MSNSLQKISYQKSSPTAHQPNTYKSALNGLGFASTGCNKIEEELQETQDSHVSSTTSFLLQDSRSMHIDTDLQIQQAQLQIEMQKNNIRQHPMYPLLAILLKHCESATTQPKSPPAIDNFNESLKEFIFEHESKVRKRFVHPVSPLGTLCSPTIKSNEMGKSAETWGNKNSNIDSTNTQANELEISCTSSSSDELAGNSNRQFVANEIPIKVYKGDAELDQFIVQAIQVLRIHALELNKASELSKNFCTRYIESLKNKFKTNQFLQDNESFSPADSSESPVGYQSFEMKTSRSTDFDETSECERCMASNECRDLHIDFCEPRSVSPRKFDYTNNMVDVLPNHCSQGTKIDDLELDCNQEEFDGLPDSYYSRKFSDSVSTPKNKAGDKTKRGVLPKKAIHSMKQWLFQHILHPYPTEDEKRVIAFQTNLTLLQVNNWFINARRRILQPILDSTCTLASNRQTGCVGCSSYTLKSGEKQSHKKKKIKISRPKSNRFWPASLAEISFVQRTPTDLDSTKSATASGGPAINDLVKKMYSNNETLPKSSSWEQNRVTSIAQSNLRVLERKQSIKGSDFCISANSSSLSKSCKLELNKEDYHSTNGKNNEIFGKDNLNCDNGYIYPENFQNRIDRLDYRADLSGLSLFRMEKNRDGHSLGEPKALSGHMIDSSHISYNYSNKVPYGQTEYGYKGNLCNETSNNKTETGYIPFDLRDLSNYPPMLRQQKYSPADVCMLLNPENNSNAFQTYNHPQTSAQSSGYENFYHAYNSENNQKNRSKQLNFPTEHGPNAIGILPYSNILPHYNQSASCNTNSFSTHNEHDRANNISNVFNDCIYERLTKNSRHFSQLNSSEECNQTAHYQQSKLQQNPFWNFNGPLSESMTQKVDHYRQLVSAQLREKPQSPTGLNRGLGND